MAKKNAKNSTLKMQGDAAVEMYVSVACGKCGTVYTFQKLPIPRALPRCKCSRAAGVVLLPCVSAMHPIFFGAVNSDDQGEDVLGYTAGHVNN